MNITVTNRYLKLPVTAESGKKTLFFYENEKIVCELISRIDAITPTYMQYVDMRELMGKTLTFSTEPEIDFIPEFTDTVPPAEKSNYRPVIHFSSQRGWINDPNGLVFYEGKYHMFFQHNPADTCWGNIHWGHAVSDDLIHWEQKEDALLPDEMGNMFSGSAIIDTENVTGLKENEHDVLLLFYTAASTTKRAAGKKFTQCMAYSTDGGNTFRKYKNNPVLDNVEGTNRDPKVIYIESEQLYYMVLWLNSDSRFALYTSKNLTDWQFTQEIVIPKDNECPDLFPLTSDKGNTYWILKAAMDRYLVGKIKNKRFHIIQQDRMLSYNGKKSYAGQTFWGIPDGRKISTSWNRSQIPNACFNGSMTSFCELTLEENGSDLMLCANPVIEYESIAEDEKTYFSPGERIILTGKAHDISFELVPEDDNPLTLQLLGLKILLCPGENRLEADETYFLSSINRYESDRTLMPLFSKNGKISLRLITDVHATEIYAGGGKACACIEHIADYNLSRLKIDGNVKECKITVKNMKPVFV
ncbi:MAG: glycoside hydrolase family 32 protein [Clostridia bacterium]|nr:glycoside hydrolase family 32 protein [Clostridia bacterium]